ncbi:hypothetical protein [Kitasatospora sp. LaBMicrA B282]|uniref:hypothetical protein n=1 Tax=Kitasatospora sp. LaBMicrA B282 TaxID=3420949 RepID=UPI003D112198
MPVVMALVWFGLDAIAAAPAVAGMAPVAVLDPERAVGVVERCEAVLRREQDHTALVLAGGRTTSAVLAEATGRHRRRTRARIGRQADRLLHERTRHQAAWWGPGHCGEQP